MIAEKIYEKTLNLINDKNIRKKIGQFFTPSLIANFMASLMTINKSNIRILDAGAGSGILAGALCEQIIQNKHVKSVHVVLCENNKTILPILEENIQYIRNIMAKHGKKITYEIISDNFILYYSHYWNNTIDLSENELFDLIISNPPYKKIRKSDEESIAMKSIVYGQPNIYYLFMAMAAKLLRTEGEMIFITPRSFTSGAYFRKFREWILNTVKLTHLHLFISRSSVFKEDKILQETIITKFIKTERNISKITITECENLEDNINKHDVDYNIIIDTHDNNYFIRIPTNAEDINVINLVNKWSYNLVSLGYKLKTGPVVDFRSTEFLSYEDKEDTVPLLWAHNMQHNRIIFPVYKEGKPQFILNNEKSRYLLLENKNYLILKRFTSKEEKRRIQVALYFSKNYKFNLIGIENHLNYITKEKGIMSEEELYGLYTILNTCFVDRYYRILNGSTQVNANEMNALPMPSLREIIMIGSIALQQDCLPVEVCDEIVLKVINGNYLEKNVG